MGRIEPIIELDGSTKKILSYGSEAEKLTTWFMLDDIHKLFPEWKIPAPPKYFNGKKFNKWTLRDSSANKTNTQETSQKDIQGYRGGRGAGSSNSSNRGQGQYQPRGRGRPTSRGGGRPSNKYIDYQTWDEEQSSGRGRGGQKWEEDSWRDHQMQPRGSRDSTDYRSERYSDVGEYYTSDYGYGFRKRERSPSPRRYKNRDYSPRDDQERRRGDRNFSPGDRGDRSDRSDREGRNGGRFQGYNR